MRVRRSLPLAMGVVLTAAAFLVVPRPAMGAPGGQPIGPGGCRPGSPGCACTVGEGLGCGVSVGTPGGGPAPAIGRADAPTAVWRSTNLCRAVGTNGGLSPIQACAGLGCVAPGGGVGVFHFFELVDVTTGAVLQDELRCVVLNAAAPPVPPPDPPTLAEVREAAPLPPLAIGRNPSGRGLTGLASWFWIEDQTDMIEVDVDLDGWHVEGELHADTWRWTVGDTTYTSSGPGSEAHPAVEHVFERKGTVEVSVEVSWSGSYTVSGYGTSFTVPGLATETSSSLDYEVIEVRGVIDTPEGEP